MQFSQILDELMKSRHISNYRMSKETGISDSLIGYWRRGERTPTAENMQKVANYFSVTTDYLLTGSNKAPASETPEISDLEKVIIERSSSPLPEEQKKALMDLIDSTIDTFLKAYHHEHENKRQ